MSDCLWYGAVSVLFAREFARWRSSGCSLECAYTEKSNPWHLTWFMVPQKEQFTYICRITSCSCWSREEGQSRSTSGPRCIRSLQTRKGSERHFDEDVLSCWRLVFWPKMAFLLPSHTTAGCHEPSRCAMAHMEYRTGTCVAGKTCTPCVLCSTPLFLKKHKHLCVFVIVE